MMFSPADIFAGFVAVFGVVLTIINIIDKSYVMKQRASEPERLQNEKIANLEGRVDELERLIEKDDRRIQSLEEGTKALIHGVNALLSYSLDDTNIGEVQQAKKGLDDYLISNSISK